MVLIRAGIVALLGFFLAIGIGVAPASAHAQLVETTPVDGAVLDAAPSTVELSFNEPVQLLDGAIQLFAGAGVDPVVLDAAVVNASASITLPEDLEDGSYALAYRFVSADGHPVSGALTFQIGDGSFPAPNLGMTAADPKVSEVIAAAITGLQYLGLLVFAGLLFFNTYVLRTTSAPDWRTRKLLRYSYGTAAGAALLLLPASGSRITGNQFITFDPEMGDFTILPASAWWAGVSWQIVVSAVVIVVFGLAALVVSGRASTRPGHITAIALAAFALAVPVLVGHTQTVQPVWAMMAADVGHLFAGAFWVGGVVGLIRYFVAEGQGSPQRAAQLVVDFSRYALYSVIVLALCGLTMAVLVVGTWGKLFGTAYGVTLLIKLGVVAAVVALAAWNRLFLIPRILARPDEVRQWTTLRRTTGFEVAILVVVIAVTGFLTNTSPNVSEPATPGSTEVGDEKGSPPMASTGEQAVNIESQGLSIDGTLSPASTGDNVLRFALTYEGEIVVPTDSESVTVEARMREQGLGPLAANVVFDEVSGEYEATVSLPIPGEWQLQIAARIDTYTHPIAIAQVKIGTP